MSKLSIEAENSCKAIANAADLATKAIANAAEQAKIVVASDAAKALQVEEKRANGNRFFDILYKQVSFGLTIITIIIGSFIYLTNPAKDNDTALQLQDQRITAQRETIDELTKTAQNDTEELKSEITGLRIEVQMVTNQIIKLQTIIEERMPKK